MVIGSLEMTVTRKTNRNTSDIRAMHGVKENLTVAQTSSVHLQPKLFLLLKI